MIPWGFLWLTLAAGVVAVYLSYLQWLSDDDNFIPDFKDFRPFFWEDDDENDR